MNDDVSSTSLLYCSDRHDHGEWLSSVLSLHTSVFNLSLSLFVPLCIILLIDGSTKEDVVVD
jgi:hypothetical protein